MLRDLLRGIYRVYTWMIACHYHAWFVLYYVWTQHTSSVSSCYHTWPLPSFTLLQNSFFALHLCGWMGLHSWSHVDYFKSLWVLDCYGYICLLSSSHYSVFSFHLLRSWCMCVLMCGCVCVGVCVSGCVCMLVCTVRGSLGSWQEEQYRKE